MASKARLFYSEKLKKGLIDKLSEKQSHYIKNVLRLRAGDKISLFNTNGEWDAIILPHDNDIIQFQIDKLSRPAV